MQLGKVASAFVLAVAASACTTTMRAPLTNVPPGTYVLVEPASDVYNAVAITDRAFALRMGEHTHTGQHWLDGQGRIHMADDTGPCAGVESIWTYTYTGNRVTLNLVEDECTARPSPMPSRLVYERQ